MQVRLGWLCAAQASPVTHSPKLQSMPQQKKRQDVQQFHSTEKPSRVLFEGTSQQRKQDVPDALENLHERSRQCNYLSIACRMLLNACAMPSVSRQTLQHRRGALAAVLCARSTNLSLSVRVSMPKQAASPTTSTARSNASCAGFTQHRDECLCDRRWAKEGCPTRALSTKTMRIGAVPERSRTSNYRGARTTDLAKHNL